MKRLMVPIILAMALSAHAQTSNVVFECKSVLSADQNETINIGIKVVEKSGQLVSYLVGSGEQRPIATVKQIVTLKSALQVGGVQQILKTTGLNPATIRNVIIYTAGNFDDDAAGVRTAEFLDKKNQVRGSGMFFGWGGPVSCQ